MAEPGPADRLPTAFASLPAQPRLLASGAGMAAIAATAAGAGALVVASGLAPESPVSVSSPPLALSWPSASLAVLLVAACWVLVTVRVGAVIGMSLVVLSWALPALAAWSALGSALRAALLGATELAPGGIALLVASWRPVPRDLGRGPTVALVAGIAGVGVHLLGYDPFFDPSCVWTCESSPTLLSGVLSAYEVALLVTACLLVAATATMVTCVRSVRAPFLMRVCGVLGCALWSAATSIRVARWGDPAAAPVLDGLQTSATSVVLGAVVVELVGGFRVRHALRDLVRQLSAAEFPRASRRSMYSVSFAIPQDGRWIDASGRPVPAEPDGRTALIPGPDGRPAIRLVTNRRADPAHVRASISPAGRLALENARLRAVAQLKLAELRASQRRIVDTTDGERRRIERDLHDGAQQRLVAVAMHLKSVGSAPESEAAILAAAAAQVRDALGALRQLSHDSLGSVLSVEGLLAAIEDLVAAVPLSVDLDTALDERPMPVSVQGTAYLAATIALDNVVAHAGVDAVQVRLTTKTGELVLVVSDEGAGGATYGVGLLGLADRVRALAGSVDLVSPLGGGTTVRVVLPCG